MLTLFFSFARCKDDWPEPQTWSGFSPTQSWPPTKIPAQTWPTNAAPWPPTRSKKPSTLQPEPSKKSNKKLIIIISSVSVVVVVVVCLLIVFRAKLACTKKQKSIKAFSATLGSDLIDSDEAFIKTN